MVNKLSIDALDLTDKKVLMRVDFNVPRNENGKISDDTRIQEALPSIHYLLSKGAKLILMSHLGRPKGKVVDSFSLKPCADHLAHILGTNVQICLDCVGTQTEASVEKMHAGDILLLENLRFNPAEEKPEKDPSFASSLASMADIYVNDAFGTAHRKHSSTWSVPIQLKTKSACGFLMKKELDALENYILNPQKPFHAIIGGAKISTKLGVLRSLIQKVDVLMIGGAMANTLLKAKGIRMGQSMLEEACLDEALQFMQACEENDVNLLLPQDFVGADSLKNDAQSKVFSVKEGLPNYWQALDIGPATVTAFSSHLKEAKTVFWNGPLGVCELDSFCKGTQEIARHLASLNLISVIGGGDSVAAIKKLGLVKQFTHISTGGGAVLEYIEQGNLPGVEVLTDAK